MSGLQDPLLAIHNCLAMGTDSSTDTRTHAVGDLRSAIEGSIRSHLDTTGILAVSGGDATRFLNSQFSSDIAALGPSAAGLTSYSDARGRVLAVPRIFAERERLLLALPADRLEPVQRQLAKYVLRADARIEDLSAEHTCMGFAGLNAAVALEGAIAGLPRTAWGTTELAGGGLLTCLPGTRPRWLAAGAPASLEPLWVALDDHAVTAPPEAWRLLDVEAGIPAIHDATAGHFVAQMLNLDRLGALDFQKGCYPGQEVIARTRYLGRIKRRMYILRSPAGPVPATGTAVRTNDETAGEIVAAAAHPDGGSLALAVLRIESAVTALAIGDGAHEDSWPATAAEPPYGLETG